MWIVQKTLSYNQAKLEITSKPHTSYEESFGLKEL